MSNDIKRRTATGVDNPMTYNLSAGHELETIAQGFADAYMDIIAASIKSQPRSQQKRIGPSEMGIACARAILHKLNGDPEPERGDVPWKPTIGTAMHAYLEDAFTAASAPGQEQQGRWVTEQQVEVGTVGQQMITGHSDLYDAWLGIVGDHKLIGRNTMKKYRAHGPGPQYRYQAHLYGRGQRAAGRKVTLVAICFLPRETELNDTYIWTEPYQEDLADEALRRVDALERLRATIGIDTALAAYQPCDDTWCDWCGSRSQFGQRPLAKTTAALFT